MSDTHGGNPAETDPTSAPEPQGQPESENAPEPWNAPASESTLAPQGPPDAPTGTGSASPSAAESAPTGEAVPPVPPPPASNPQPPAPATRPPAEDAPTRYEGVRPAPRSTAPAAHPAAGYQPGQSFVPVVPWQTQPTQPLADPLRRDANEAATAASDPRRNRGAAKVAGLIVAAALVGGAAGLGGTAAGIAMWGGQSRTPVAAPSSVTVNNPDSVNATTAIASKVLPSVVTLEVSNGSSGGSGSGVVLSSDGYVVTNTHVVTLDGSSDQSAVRATTSDGRIFDAEIVGLDPIYDLAVIKLVDASGLTPIEFADSSELDVGSTTVAVGAPLGLANTVTTGIVSALDRSIEIASAAVPDTEDGDGRDPQEPGEGGPFFFDMPGQEAPQGPGTESIMIAVIQTDAAINPGNSGGALVDADGRLIGVNVAIATAGQANESGSIGVGFSIPSNIVERVSDEIIADGAATHGLLGATVSPASTIDGATIAGAAIQEVTADGPAAGVGLQSGDIVTEFNGVVINDSIDLTAQVRAAAAGSDATVTYVRNGETTTLDVTLGELAP